MVDMDKLQKIVSDQAPRVDLGLLEEDQGYVYPNGLDLRPTSELHQQLVSLLMQRARLSRDVMSQRYDVWRKIDDSMTAYVQLDKEELEVKAEDPRKPVSIIVPLTFAIHETFLTYLVRTFLVDPIFRYEPTGPEDSVGVLILERLIDLQMRRSRAGLNLITQWSDALKYGVGVVTPVWEVRRGMIPTAGFGRTFEEGVLYEGHALENVNQYLYLPDPSVSASDVQRAEFVGWLTRENRFTLLKREYESEGSLFNARYLPAVKGHSQLLDESYAWRGGRETYTNKDLPYANTVDVLWMYVELIPSEWGLGDESRPEKWVFAVANDSLLLAAQPVDLIHNMFPVVACAPLGDGYSPVPISVLEVIQGLQETADWMYSTHITNVRKSINDMLVVDPMMVNMNDLKRPDKAGGLIRLRKSAWGRGVNDAVKQLQVVDITRGHVEDTVLINDMMQRVTGANDTLQGIPRKAPDRLTATEAQALQVGAVSRLAKMVKVISLQSMQDLALMLAMQTQQLMENEVGVKLIGRYGEDLAAEYGLESSDVVATYEDIQVPFDVNVGDQVAMGEESPDVWVQILQIVLSQPEVFGELDPVRIFKHAARVAGAKNLSEFERKKPQVRVAPDEQVAEQAQAGNIAPLEAILNG